MHNTITIKQSQTPSCIMVQSTPGSYIHSPRSHLGFSLYSPLNTAELFYNGITTLTHCGFTRRPTNQLGFHRLTKNLGGFTRRPTNQLGFHRLTKNLGGFTWISTNQLGFHRLTKNLGGFTQRSINQYKKR